ncbi:MAG: hypothetical protein KAY27_00670 [Pedobacter sp.]|nr:hypothetical protein [Pedobacter sp.]
MTIIELKERQITTSETKLTAIYFQFGELLIELGKKELSLNSIELINKCVEIVNNSSLEDKKLIKLIKEKQTAILKQVEKEHKIVPKNYYRNLWMLFGMSGIGLPIGVAFGLTINNIGMLGIGLPIGMGIGLAIGASLDKKALNQGKQLDLEIKH